LSSAASLRAKGGGRSRVDKPKHYQDNPSMTCEKPNHSTSESVPLADNRQQRESGRLPKLTVRKAGDQNRALVSEIDADLRQYRWRTSRDGYAIIFSYRTQKEYSLHRIIGERMAGRFLAKTEIMDHINGIKTDNRRENLRLTTHAGNAENRNDNPFRGARQSPGGRWMALVRRHGKQHYLGTFDTKEEAAAASKKKREELKFLSSTP